MTWQAISNYSFRILALSLLVSVLGACGYSSSVKKHETRIVPRSIAAESELLYQILAGEFAGVRGDLDASVDFYQQAASLSTDPNISARAAYIALYTNRYDEALQLTERWQALDGDSDAITRARALIYLRQEEVELAATEIERLLFTEGHIELGDVAALGQILKKEARPMVALSVLDTLNKLHAKQTGLLLLQARFEVTEKHYDKAMVLIEQVIQLAPDISDAYLIKAQILAAEDRDEEAVKAVAFAVGKRPDDHRLRLQYARMLVQMKYFDEAWKNFIMLKEATPEDENILLSLGLLSVETGKIKRAKQYFQELIDKGFHDFQAHYYLGRIQQNEKEYMPAIANYERVTEGPYRLDARIRAAGLLAETGQVEQALQQLKILNENQQNGDQVLVYLAQGEVLRKAHREEEALGLYTQALKEAPENTDLLYARALTAEKLDKLDITESDLRMVLMHEPDNATALNALGYTLADRNQRLDEAKEYILKAARLLPDDPSILDSLGWVYFRLGQFKDSIKWLTKAFARIEDAEIAAHLGEALWMDGQQDSANKIWQRGLEKKADNPVLLNTIKRYKK